MSVIRQDTVTRPSGVPQPPQGTEPACEVSRLSYTWRCDITAGCGDNKAVLPAALWELFLPTELRLSWPLPAALSGPSFASQVAVAERQSRNLSFFRFSVDVEGFVVSQPIGAVTGHLQAYFCIKKNLR